jgi:hypothetical protein
MRVERVFNIAVQDRLQSWRIRESEYSKTKIVRLEKLVSKAEQKKTHFGFDFGAQTTANDSGSIL